MHRKLKFLRLFLVASTLIFVFTGCGDDTRFTIIDPTTSGISFINQLSSTAELNPYTYKGFFNGGGVALGDLDNDGLMCTCVNQAPSFNRIVVTN